MGNILDKCSRSNIHFEVETAVIDQGRIVEQGSHEELVVGEGTYANLWLGQAEASAADD
ncbi:hypothetical protein [Halorubrum sp. AS12]|uniref:hypothetical protein n=1 Tax=Halorubrum sp. AS12 TaxID=3409687 RepID=UPI003DA7A2F7